MKICVLSDVHGNAVALTKVIEECKAKGIDKYIFLGDLLIKGPSPGVVYDLMVKLSPLCWIKGNTDEAFELEDQWDTLVKDATVLNYLKYPLTQLSEENLDFIMSMNYRESIDVEGIRILCTHGSPRDIAENVYPNLSDEEYLEILEDVDEDIVLCGHTHDPMLRTIAGKTIFNPGSISFSATESGIVSYGVIEICDGRYECTLKVLDYDKKEAINQAIENGMPNIDDFKNLIDY